MASEPCDACGRDGYSNPAVAVDAVALREGEAGIEALLIRRGGAPEVWKGRWAFPGGFVAVSYTHLTLPTILLV